MPAAMSSLIPEQALIVSPQLAATIGLEEALLLGVLNELQQHRPGEWCQGTPDWLHRRLPFWQAADVARITLDAGRYADDASRARFFATLLERLRARPEIEAAGAVSLLPLRDGTTDWAVAVSGSSAAPPDELQFEQSRFASDGYFDALGIPILAGRDFTAADRDSSAPVAIVSSSFAARSGGTFAARATTAASRRIRRWKSPARRAFTHS